MLAYAEVCWSKGIAVYIPLPSPMPSDEYGECSCFWYKRKCLPLIKDLLQSANLIQSSAVLCSMLNASRSFMANRSPHLLHRGLHFVCPQTDTIQCSSWVSLAHQVECVLWFYHPFFFFLCSECLWICKITFHQFPALNVFPQRPSLAKGLGIQTLFCYRDDLCVSIWKFRFVEEFVWRICLKKLFEEFASYEYSQKASSSIQILWQQTQN